MWIVAVAWIYVIALVAVNETSVVAGVMTFVGYCVVPLSILLYLTGGKGRRRRRDDAAARARSGDNHASADSGSDSSSE